MGLLTFATGALGDPFGDDEVPFESIRRAHFDALAVQHFPQPPTGAPLILRLNLQGDVDEASFDRAGRWLALNANIIVVRDREGAPLVMTEQDLSATSGRATLGATLRTGMAVEVRNADVAPCVITHEILHFVGLGHTSDDRNIMGPHCRPHKLDHAQITPEQILQVSQVGEIRAATPKGAALWAHR